MERSRIARVVLVPSMGRLSVLDYAVTPDQREAAPGSRVLVPVGARRVMGILDEFVDETPHAARLKEVAAVLDAEPVLHGSLLRLVRWMAEYYLAPLGEAFSTALPGSLRVETERYAVAAEGVRPTSLAPAEAQVLTHLVEAGPAAVAALARRFGPGAPAALARLRRKGLVRFVERLRREVAPTRHVRSYAATAAAAPAEALLARRPALRSLHRYLREHPLGRASAAELRGSFPDAAGKLRELTALHLVRCIEEESYRPVLPPEAGADRAVRLNAAQQEAVGAISAAIEAAFEAFLLWGVTGSGKTEVYLRVVSAALARGRTALILVPEISLTHQLVDRVRARFGDRVAVLHSQLSTGERWDEWRRIARGEARIVIGARSAVFAPLRDLGVIVVDEEHDPAYKQGEGVYYQGRDVAVMRAKMENCPAVLGSATPSMESFHNASTGRYRLLSLPERVEARPLPLVELVDLREAEETPPRRPEGGAAGGDSRAKKPPPSPISPVLAAALSANLGAGGQSLIFLNRRGFANFFQCRACGDAVMCPNCSVTLTWHRQWRALRCHYCDHTVPPPARCPGCGDTALETWGVGTEQLEGLLREMLPGARVARMDRDTTRRRGSQQALLHAWAAGKIDVLIGTQMITKGHDIPGVTLVGVLLADLSLNFPDFRAGERTFQLLAQVAGRAGRGERPGRVIVQTLQPAHYSLRAAREHDFRGFAEREMEARRELDYPPYSRLVLLRLEGERAEAVEKIAREVTARLRERAARRFLVLGPAPAPLERLRGRHRWQVLVRGRSGAAVRQAVAEARAAVRETAGRAGVRVIADVDPCSML